MAEYIELDIEAGANFALQIEIVNNDDSIRNLVNHVITSQLKKSIYSTEAIDFVIFTTDAANGNVAMTLSANTTTNLELGRYVYSVRMNDVANNFTERLFDGIVTVS